MLSLLATLAGEVPANAHSVVTTQRRSGTTSGRENCERPWGLHMHRVELHVTLCCPAKLLLARKCRDPVRATCCCRFVSCSWAASARLRRRSTFDGLSGTNCVSACTHRGGLGQGPG